mmetsp:Transcript_119200/g.187021  ORF Transcript_119200/g.187021 Transcript_119200/m.187021 type:complete len:237 (-) Transcript_119200:899-1609(-)
MQASLKQSSNTNRAFAIALCGFTLLGRRIVDGELDAFHLGEIVQSVFGFITSPAASLVATEWSCIIKLVPSVDPYRPSLKTFGNANGLTNVAAANASRETIDAIVCTLNCLINGLELQALHDRTKDLFFANLHVIRNIAEDSGLNKEALVAFTSSSTLNLGTLGLPRLDVAHNFVELYLINHWSLVALGISGADACLLGLCFLHDLGHERIMNRFLDQDPGGSAAALAAVEEETKI